MKIGICSDHAGFLYKEKLRILLEKKGFEVKDYGTFSEESVDYADYAHALGYGLTGGEVEKGIAICGSGEGMAITLNRHKGIRAGLAWNCAIGRLIKEHNDANVLVLPARFISFTMATRIFGELIGAEFTGGRHLRRIEKIEL